MVPAVVVMPSVVPAMVAAVVVVAAAIIIAAAAIIAVVIVVAIIAAVPGPVMAGGMEAVPAADMDADTAVLVAVPAVMTFAGRGGGACEGEGYDRCQGQEEFPDHTHLRIVSRCAG
jgi:hypothetical protein